MDFSMKKIATYFRLLGYDTMCDRDIPHDQIIEIASMQDRCVITASPSLARRLEAHDRCFRKQQQEMQEEGQLARAGHHKRFVMYASDGDSVYSDTSNTPIKAVEYIEIQQWRKADFQNTIVDLITRARLAYDTLYVFSRCVDCNDVLVEVEKGLAKGSVLESVFSIYQDFTMCPKCRKVFWGFKAEEAINYKTLRTLEMLHTLCVRAGAPVLCGGGKKNTMKRIYSLPRSVKLNILSFIEKDHLTALMDVFPALTGLVDDERK
ncbi:unnamed protein product [Phytomonas sp. EM1]|nr:unnamed protein product [Phytomonas sp. EM1]|eukprot:CCW62739.1 unnamed protein product [Phytomonas sp. isolate EM1]